MGISVIILNRVVTENAELDEGYDSDATREISCHGDTW